MTKSVEMTEEDINLLTFPQRLYLLLDTEKDGYIRWADHGFCFRIVDHRKFVKNIIPKYFKQTKFTSFQRQLNIYGFRKLLRGDDRGSYFHPLFQMNRRELLHELKRSPGRGSLQSFDEVVSKSSYRAGAPKPNNRGVPQRKMTTRSSTRYLAAEDVAATVVDPLILLDEIPLDPIISIATPLEKIFELDEEEGEVIPDDLESLEILSVLEETLLEPELIPIVPEIAVVPVDVRPTTPRIVPVQMLAAQAIPPPPLATVPLSHYVPPPAAYFQPAVPDTIPKFAASSFYGPIPPVPVPVPPHHIPHHVVPASQPFTTLYRPPVHPAFVDLGRNPFVISSANTNTSHPPRIVSPVTTSTVPSDYGVASNFALESGAMPSRQTRAGEVATGPIGPVSMWMKVAKPQFVNHNPPLNKTNQALPALVNSIEQHMI